VLLLIFCGKVSKPGFAFRQQFKANPVDRRVLASDGGLGVKQIPAKPATVVQPFKLSSGVHRQDTSAASESSDTTEFHARPAPKGILEGVVVSRLELALYRTRLSSVILSFR